MESIGKALSRVRSEVQAAVHSILPFIVKQARSDLALIKVTSLKKSSRGKYVKDEPESNINPCA